MLLQRTESVKSLVFTHSTHVDRAPTPFKPVGDKTACPYSLGIHSLFPSGGPGTVPYPCSSSVEGVVLSKEFQNPGFKPGFKSQVCHPPAV